jgi:hypothetical protein
VKEKVRRMSDKDKKETRELTEAIIAFIKSRVEKKTSKEAKADISSQAR